MNNKKRTIRRNIRLPGAKTTTLIGKDNQASRRGDISRILISNNDGHQADGVCVFLEDETYSTSTHGSNTKFYFIRDVVIPVGTTLVLDECLTFDSHYFHLRIVTQNASDGGAPNLTVMIE
jgi:hypothetical protein